jgi:hypothetical protein
MLSMFFRIRFLLFLIMFTFNLNKFFNPNKFCLMSRTLHHHDIKKPRYDWCERLNLN